MVNIVKRKVLTNKKKLYWNVMMFNKPYNLTKYLSLPPTPFLPFPTLCQNFYIYAISKCLPLFVAWKFNCYTIIEITMKMAFKTYFQKHFEFWKGSIIWVKKFIFFDFYHLIAGQLAGKIINPPATVWKWNDQLNKTFVTFLHSL